MSMGWKQMPMPVPGAGMSRGPFGRVDMGEGMHGVAQGPVPPVDMGQGHRVGMGPGFLSPMDAGQGYPMGMRPDPDRNCDCPPFLTRRVAILRLLSQPIDGRVFFPKVYLAAASEVFIGTLIITWLITALFYRDQITDHPARAIIGSLNPCFGWDYPPAAYIAVPLCAFNVYFGWRYVWLKQVRANLLNEPTTPARIFDRVVSIIFGLCNNLWLNLWLIGPTSDPPGDEDPYIRAWWGHTGIFLLYALFAYLSFLGLYLDVLCSPRSWVILPKHTVFLVVYGLAVFYMLFVYTYCLRNYEYGQPPALPGVFTEAADLIWMACGLLVLDFMPPEPPLRTTTAVLHLAPDAYGEMF